MSRRDWAALQSNALFCIAGKLKTIDYITFRAVCRSWFSAVPEIPLQAPHAPYLLLGPIDRNGDPENKTGLFNFVSLPDNALHRFRIPKLVGKCCIGSQYGWLVAVDTHSPHDLSLLNPFTAQEIALPPIAAPNSTTTPRLCKFLGAHRHTAVITTIVLSSDPADGTAFTVAAVIRRMNEPEPRLIFTRAGESEWHSYPNRENHKFYNLAFDPHGRLIALASADMGGLLLRLIVIDVASGESRTLVAEDSHLPRSVSSCLVAHGARDDAAGGSGALYVSKDSISRGDRTDTIKIFEAATSPTAEGRCTTISPTSLGGRALFASRRSSVLLSAADVRRLKLKENHVYFTGGWWFVFSRLFAVKDEDLGTYNLEDRTTSFLRKADKIKRGDCKAWLAPIWITPSLRRRPTE